MKTITPGGIRSTMRASLTCAVALTVALATGFGSAHAQGVSAGSILKKMSDYVSSQPNIELTFDSDIEVITPHLEKLQFANSGEVLLSRPDKLRATRTGGYADIALYFDGKMASVLGKNINGYAQFDLKGSLDDLFAALRSGRGVALPGADLLVARPYDTLIADVMEARYIGRGVIDGRECEHLAFRNFDTDWQLWVEVGDKAIPRKLVITTKDVNNAPQYTLRIKSWKTGVAPAPDAFAFVVPAGAKRLNADLLIDLDEIPSGNQSGAIK